MKIDFDMLEKQVAAGMPAQALLIYFRTLFEAHQAKRASKRPADAKRAKARRARDMGRTDGGLGRDAGVTEVDSGVTEAPSKVAERDLFARAKQVIGKTCGGLVASLVKHHKYDLRAAREVIEAAAAKADPREYVVGSMRRGNGSGSETMAAFDDLIARAEGTEVAGDHRVVDIAPGRSEGR